MILTTLITAFKTLTCFNDIFLVFRETISPILQAFGLFLGDPNLIVDEFVHEILPFSNTYWFLHSIKSN
jgi:hypothetical protein